MDLKLKNVIGKAYRTAMNGHLFHLHNFLIRAKNYVTEERSELVQYKVNGINKRKR